MNRFKRALVTFIALCLALALCSCSKPSEGADEPAVDPSLPAQLQLPKVGDTVVTFETNKGNISAVIFEDLAPLAAENFLTHARNGYYNELIFHRVVYDFVIQTGDPTGTGRGGDSIWGEPFKNEYSQELHHYYGALGMANAGTDQNRSQFYMVAGGKVEKEVLEEMKAAGYADDVVAAYEQLGGQPGLDFKYTVFGQVYEGFDVLDTIAKVKTDGAGLPNKEVKLVSVTVSSYTELAVEPVEGSADADAQGRPAKPLPAEGSADDASVSRPIKPPVTG